MPSNFIFKNPTIRSLSTALFVMLSLTQEASTLAAAAADSPDSRVKVMEAFVAKYTKDLPIHTPDLSYPTQKANEEVIVLSGSTGGLGSHLLAQLIQTKTVVRVYALNRKSANPLWKRQVVVLAERLGNDAEAWDVMLSPKLRLVEATLEAEDLGLDKELYDEVRMRVTSSGDWVADIPTSFQIRTSATMIIHNAWHLDFNLSLDSFTP